MLYSDISIIGSSFFATSMALLLSEQGYSVNLITEEHEPLGTCMHTLATMWPSLNDPPTRAEVAHGHEVACYLNDFCSLGIEFFCTHFHTLIKQTSSWIKAPAIRIGAQTFEQDELKKAKELGFGLRTTQHKEIYLEKNPSFICTNIDLFKREIKKLLQKNAVNLITQKVTRVTEEQGKCFINLKDYTLASEIVVLGNDVGVSSLLPKYKSILVPMSDILYIYSCAVKKKCEPVSLRAANGHVAAVLFCADNKVSLKITGPRFLLPQAGAGIVLNKEDIDAATFSRINKYHKQIFYFLSLYYNYDSLENFLQDFPFEQNDYFLGVDCYPCDELPLLGEFGKLGKILGNTGWLATDFSAGVWGAKIITDLICQQKSEFLHPRLQPRRFDKIVR